MEKTKLMLLLVTNNHVLRDLNFIQKRRPSWFFHSILDPKAIVLRLFHPFIFIPVWRYCRTGGLHLFHKRFSSFTLTARCRRQRAWLFNLATSLRSLLLKLLVFCAVIDDCFCNQQASNKRFPPFRSLFLNDLSSFGITTVSYLIFSNNAFPPPLLARI